MAAAWFGGSHRITPSFSLSQARFPLRYFRMQNHRSLSCCLIGDGMLVLRCGELLLSRGHIIHGLISKDPAVARWAAKNAIPYQSSTAEQAAFLGRRPFDCLFSIVNDTITPPEVLRLPRVAAVNYHDAPLPKYAGFHVTAWAILNRESAHGVTWHEMAETVDSGRILKQRAVEIAPDETAFTLSAKCAEAAVVSFGELVDELAAGRVEGREQNVAERTYFYRNARPEAGGVLLWNQPAVRLDALARALSFSPDLNPLGLAKLYTGRGFVVVHGLQVVPGTGGSAPGTITRLTAGSLQVATATEEVLIEGIRGLDGESLSIDRMAAAGRAGGGRAASITRPGDRRKPDPRISGFGPA